MENEINKNNENDISLHKSVEIEKIIEFYKDKPIPEEDTSEKALSDTPHRFIELIDKFKNKTKRNDGIITENYGLSERGKLILYRIISGAVSLLIILGAFILAYYLPSNDEIIENKQNELRQNDEYANLKSRYDTLKTEVKNIKSSNKSKKKQVDQIDDIDNTKAELRTKITEKTYELDELNKAIAEKREQIAQLDAQIAKKAPPDITLPPGRYVAGKNIAAGKYKVTGTGKFMLSTSAGKSKINTALGAEPIDVTITDGDIVKFDSKVKFTSQS